MEPALRSFRFWNNLIGWAVFLVALITYCLTLEPTVSFWDAGEYIATSANLEVGHPPGAPVFQMLGAVFASFAPDSSQIALMLNFMSGLASAFTILLLFRSLSILLLKISGPAEQLSVGAQTAIIGSAVIGALSFSFTDSFWFSAVETEVYALSSFLTALLFYLGLLWERDLKQERGNRWLILICFVVGLSFGVHFLTILTVPAIGLLYFFKTTTKVTLKNFIVAHVAVAVVLLVIFKLLLPGTLKLFASSEVFFTNSLGLPFNSGTLIAFLLLVTVFFFGLRVTAQKHYLQLHKILLCVLFLLIGFSGWMMLPIRANAQTVINENNPDDARELLAYYNREQYGESYLFYGPQYTEMYAGLDSENPFRDGRPNYERDLENGRYVIVNDYKNARQNLDDRHKTLLPRMWSTRHATGYMHFSGFPKFSIKPEFLEEKQLINMVQDFRKNKTSGNIGPEEYHRFLSDFGEYLHVQPPSFLANLRFTLEYQIGYMYWRYFMWNFVGRQNDIQGKGNILNGNWLSGISSLDALRLGPQHALPTDMKDNKARNTYFFLPLLLGILGFIFHFKKDSKMAWVLLIFFLFTGPILSLYLNQAPYQVRERDYVLVGSFYIFGLWIGIGSYALFNFFRTYLRPLPALLLVFPISLLIPLLLATQNWDDHDRSHRYSALAMAKMYLDSVEPNAILFTSGDNDTFLLWYAQQIEGYRRDVRVVNTVLLGTDWHIDQMKRKAWESDPVPSQLKPHQYHAGINDFIIYQPVAETEMDINTWMNWISSEHPGTFGKLQSGHTVKTFPSKDIIVSVNKDSVLEYGIVEPKDAEKIVDNIPLNINANVLYKNELFMLDILANNQWKRPIYFSGGSFDDKDYLWMRDYLQLQGMVYKLLPIHSPWNPEAPLEIGRIDTDSMHDIVTNWDWGNMENSEIYHDPFTRRNGITYRRNLARLSEAFLAQGNKERAKEILDLGMEKLPFEIYGNYFLLEPYISGYYEIGKPEKGRRLLERVAEKYQENLTYYSSWQRRRQLENVDLILGEFQMYSSLLELLSQHEEKEKIAQETRKFESYLLLFPLLGE